MLENIKVLVVQRTVGLREGVLAFEACQGLGGNHYSLLIFINLKLKRNLLCFCFWNSEVEERLCRLGRGT